MLATRLHLGSALGGLILLAIATNLPEIAITPSPRRCRTTSASRSATSSAASPSRPWSSSALDVFGVRGKRPLTYRAASLVLVLEGALVVAVLGVVIAGSQLAIRAATAT